MTRKSARPPGSYYTPDYIVKYIVQHTVGPVLERKFDELRTRFHQAQREYRQARALALKKGEDPEKFWALHEPNSKMSLLVDDARISVSSTRRWAAGIFWSKRSFCQQ